MSKINAIFLTAVLGLALIGFSPLSFVSAASYNNVQILIQTASELPNYFTVSAFNMSGYMVASYQSHYPAASFELPNGEYVFTVTADRSSDQIYYSPLSAGASTSVLQGTNVGSSSPVMPFYVSPVVEYGYSVQQVSGSTAFTIISQNVTSFSTTKLVINVAFANGTAAEGAYVSASVIGSWYYWGYEDNTVLWNTTQADGVATLITPKAPVQVDAWNWVPVNLPGSQTTVTVVVTGGEVNVTTYWQPTVAGEEVNVTTYWQPMYVGLAGSTFIIPPQTSASITLHNQQSNYWVIPLPATGTQTIIASAPTVGGEATISSSPASIPVSVYQQQQGNPILQNYQPPGVSSTNTSSSTSGSKSTPTVFSLTGSTLILLIITAAALAVAGVSLMVATRIRGKKQMSDRSPP